MSAIGRRIVQTAVSPQVVQGPLEHQPDRHEMPLEDLLVVAHRLNDGHVEVGSETETRIEPVGSDEVHDVGIVTVVGADGLGSETELPRLEDRKSTRLNSSHVRTSYAVFCLKKKRYS